MTEDHFNLAELDLLGPGVRGYAQEHRGELWVSVVWAEREGSGDVGRWLDTLPKDRTVVFSRVLSARLAGMLDRRGFRPEVVLADVQGGQEVLETYVRRAEGDT